MRVLVVAAHPDDEVLGCGGTIARMAGEGHQVYISILGEGITSRFKERDQADQGMVQDIKVNGRRAAALLGAEEVFFHNLPDNRFDTVPLLSVVKAVEELLECISPDVVYTHHDGDLNIDHQVVHRAVLTAARPVPGQTVREVYAFEVPSSSEWSFNCFSGFKPNVFVEITDTLGIKLEALSEYESEIRQYPHPRSTEAVRCIAQRWGTVVGCQAAEAFQLIRAIR